MDQTPWLVKEAYEQIERHARPDWVGWEWGCGGSTVWLGRRLKSLTSLEHDGQWHAQVKERLNKFGVHNVKLVHAGRGTAYFVEYADHILSVPDESTISRTTSSGFTDG